jgi:hypothetical protein
MRLNEALRALRRAGRARNRGALLRDAPGEEAFGAGLRDLARTARTAGTDHRLALLLWDTQVVDARRLAARIADPERCTSAQLDAWAAGTGSAAALDDLAALVATTRFAREKAERWRVAGSDGLARAGWALVARLALRDAELADRWFASCLADLERGRDAAAPRRREAMDAALVAIGGRNAALRSQALLTAARACRPEIGLRGPARRRGSAEAAIAASWSRAESRGHASPAAEFQARERASGS